MVFNNPQAVIYAIILASTISAAAPEESDEQTTEIS
jgi:hypothetical protein